jgi:hypothetical protein
MHCARCNNRWFINYLNADTYIYTYICSLTGKVPEIASQVTNIFIYYSCYSTSDFALTYIQTVLKENVCKWKRIEWSNFRNYWMLNNYHSIIDISLFHKVVKVDWKATLVIIKSLKCTCVWHFLKSYIVCILSSVKIFKLFFVF